MFGLPSFLLPMSRTFFKKSIQQKYAGSRFARLSKYSLSFRALLWLNNLHKIKLRSRFDSQCWPEFMKNKFELS